MSQLGAWCESDLGRRGLLYRVLTGDLLGSLKMAKKGAYGVVTSKTLDASKSAARHQRAKSRYTKEALSKNRLKESLVIKENAAMEGEQK